MCGAQDDDLDDIQQRSGCAAGVAGYRPGAMIRVSHELFEHLELTAEVSVNETVLAPTNDGRVVFGFVFGRWARPRDLSNHRTPLGTDVPRVRYVLFP
jgi:hypothetical protein